MLRLATSALLRRPHQQTAFALSALRHTGRPVAAAAAATAWRPLGATAARAASSAAGSSKKAQPPASPTPTLPYAPAKLHFVKQIRSTIKQTEEVKRTMRALGLTRINSCKIHKNTPAVNGRLSRVVHLVQISPLRFDPDRKPPRGYDFFLSDDGVVAGGTEEEFLAYMDKLERAGEETVTAEGHSQPPQ